ncbi:MAG: hypothetical protein LUF29_05125 [Oscillospiraceae bacterium]|nr:hypothetical protein [Oscillospiraceae bacterium]
MQKMTTSDYYKYKSAIETANKSDDKESLRKIQLQLIANYGLDNPDVRELLRIFKYSV